MFFEKNLVWKKGHEVPTSSEKPLDAARAQYFHLREYLRSNYAALDGRLAQKMTDNPGNEHYPRAKELLDQIAFDDRFDPSTISRKDLELVRGNVLGGDLELFHNELATLARGMIIDDVAESLAEVGTAYAMEQAGSIRPVEVMVMEAPQIETIYDPKTRTTIIRMTDLTTGRVIYEKSHEHPFPNENPNLGSAASMEAGSITKVYGVDVMATPAVEEIHDPRTNTVELRFTNPLGGKPFWVKKLEAVEIQ